MPSHTYRRVSAHLNHPTLKVPVAGSYELRLSNTGDPNRDQTNFVAGVLLYQARYAGRRTQSPAVLDASFQNQTTGNYTYQPTGGAWTYYNAAGLSLTGNAGAFGAASRVLQYALDNKTVYFDRYTPQCLFLQGASAYVSQSITLPPGVYQLHLLLSPRESNGDLVTHVTLNGVELVAAHPPDTYFHRPFASPFFQVG